MSLPRHITENEGRMWALRKIGNTMRGRYGVPAYLCGSALREDNPEPRDWDIRIELPDEEFEARFGITPKQWEAEGLSGDWTDGRWRWSDECVKQNRWIRRCAPGLGCIDLQIYAESHCRKKHCGLPKVRIDTRPGALPLTNVEVTITFRTPDAEQALPRLRRIYDAKVLQGLSINPGCEDGAEAIAVRAQEVPTE